MPVSDRWHRLDCELDRWQAEGRTAHLWLRDDDVVEPTPALDRLLGLTGRYDVPVLLAVVPLTATPALARRLERATAVSPCQHGCAHRNHAAPDQKREELGGHRPLTTVVAELAAARDRLADLLGDAVLPVLVPPWNRIAPAVTAELPALGFSALSTFGSAQTSGPVPRIDCDIDIIDWKGGRRGRRPEEFAAALVETLAGARDRGGRPVGILGHHLVHDEVAWSFLEDLLARTASHPAARWVSFETLMSTPGGQKTQERTTDANSL